MSRSRALSNAWNLQFELCRISPRRSFRNSPGHSQIYIRGTFKIQGKLYLAMESVNRRFERLFFPSGGDIGSFFKYTRYYISTLAFPIIGHRKSSPRIISDSRSENCIFSSDIAAFLLSSLFIFFFLNLFLLHSEINNEDQDQNKWKLLTSIRRSSVVSRITNTIRIAISRILFIVPTTTGYR